MITRSQSFSMIVLYHFQQATFRITWFDERADRCNIPQWPNACQLLPIILCGFPAYPIGNTGSSHQFAIVTGIDENFSFYSKIEVMGGFCRRKTVLIIRSKVKDRFL